MVTWNFTAVMTRDCRCGGNTVTATPLRHTLWKALQLWTVQLPYQAVIQPDRMLSMVHLPSHISSVSWGWRGAVAPSSPSCLCEGTISGCFWTSSLRLRRCGWGAFSLLSPVVHNQLLNFVDVEGEVIFRAPLRQGSHLFHVGQGSPTGIPSLLSNKNFFFFVGI
jgi:hypothetical protein